MWFYGGAMGAMELGTHLSIGENAAIEALHDAIHYMAHGAEDLLLLGTWVKDPVEGEIQVRAYVADAHNVLQTCPRDLTSDTHHTKEDVPFCTRPVVIWVYLIWLAFEPFYRPALHAGFLLLQVHGPKSAQDLYMRVHRHTIQLPLWTLVL